MMRKAQNQAQAGYTLVELLLVIVVGTIVTVSAVINIGPMLVTFDIDQVATKVAASVSRVRREALRGDTNSPAYNTQSKNFPFDAMTAVVARHPGIYISNVSPGGTTTACQTNTCTSGQTNMCISGEQLCYQAVSKFNFIPYSGRLANNYAIFIISNSRKLAVLVSRDGKTDIAELVNGQWRSRTDLQNLHQ
jgi:prepilin-type N-terminal cleavage/methylation domain-containing protein